MRHNSHILLAKLLEKGGIRFKAQFFESLLDMPNPHRNSIIEMILNQLNSFQEDQFVAGQIFRGVVYAPDPFYFLLFFEKPKHKSILFDTIRQSHPNEWIGPMQRIKMYDEDEHNRRQRASLNLPIIWRAELNSMNYNWPTFNYCVYLWYIVNRLCCSVLL